VSRTFANVYDELVQVRVVFPAAGWRPGHFWGTIEHDQNPEPGGRSPAVDLSFEFLWKDAASNTGNCPSLSRSRNGDRDGYLVAGIPVAEGTRARIPHISDGEMAVWVPANVIERIKELL
jgi:hypothetical protein